MIAAAAWLLLLASAAQPAAPQPTTGAAMSCEQLRAEADRLQAQMDGMIGSSVDAELASMRARREGQAAGRAASAITAIVPIVGGYIADGITMAREAREAALERRSDALMEEVVETGPQLGRRLGDLEMAYEMQCRRPAAAQARGAQP